MKGSIEYIDMIAGKKTTFVKDGVKLSEVVKSAAALGEAVSIVLGSNLKERSKDSLEVVKDIASFIYSSTETVLSYSKDKIQENGLNGFVSGIPNDIRVLKELVDSGIDPRKYPRD
jgi:hypothetical protein